MCNLYKINASLSIAASLQKAFGIREDDLDWFHRQQRENEDGCYPKGPAPTIIPKKTQRRLIPARFGLIPWGGDGKIPYNNARMDSFNIWPWETCIKRSRCIIPVTSYFEYAYWGDEIAGHKLEFSCSGSPVLYAAGIYNHIGDEYSMTMITRPASEDMMENGHHRMPMFIDPTRTDEWLEGEKGIKDCQKVLADIAADLDFEYEILEEMKGGPRGWQSRVPERIKKRDAEIAAVEKYGPMGFALR